MSVKRKRGRKSKPYLTSWGETIDGLYRKPDGRWRFVASGHEFREDDERIAVARFKQWRDQHLRHDLTVPVTPEDLDDIPRLMDRGGQLTVTISDEGPPTSVLALAVPESAIWPWFRDQLLNRPDVVADKVGIPQLQRLADLPLPRPSIPLANLIKMYKNHAGSSGGTKRKVETAWNEMTATTGASTLRELTSERLVAYADSIRQRLSSPDSVATIFQRIKTVIGFGLKRGLDAMEIRGALDRAAVLTPPKRTSKYTPFPIAPDVFHRLLKHANELETAALLFSLNCCMYASEMLAADWEEIDGEKSTYLADVGRAKTNVVRAAALWPRTIAALKQLPRTPGAIFKSRRGNRYHPNSFRKLFAALRRRAGVGDQLEFNSIRDGAYTAACAAGVEFHLTQILAGHKTAGQADNYIARHPGMVKPACEAIERHYFPPTAAGRPKRHFEPTQAK